MKFARLLLLLVPLLLTACGLSDQQKADYGSVQRSGVNSAVYDKMVHGDNLSLYDIKALSRAGVSDAVTLRYLRNQGTTYFLSSDDVTSLRKAGVSQSVVDFMLQSSRRSGYGYGYGPYGGYPGYGYDPFWGDPFWGPYPYPYAYGGFGYRRGGWR
jgi:hypothetical protein